MNTHFTRYSIKYIVSSLINAKNNITYLNNRYSTYPTNFFFNKYTKESYIFLLIYNFFGCVQEF